MYITPINYSSQNYANVQKHNTQSYFNSVSFKTNPETIIKQAGNALKNKNLTPETLMEMVKGRFGGINKEALEGVFAAVVTTVFGLNQKLEESNKKFNELTEENYNTSETLKTTQAKNKELTDQNARKQSTIDDLKKQLYEAKTTIEQNNATIAQLEEFKGKFDIKATAEAKSLSIGQVIDLIDDMAKTKTDTLDNIEGFLFEGDEKKFKKVQEYLEKATTLDKALYAGAINNNEVLNKLNTIRYSYSTYNPHRNILDMIKSSLIYSDRTRDLVMRDRKQIVTNNAKALLNSYMSVNDAVEKELNETIQDAFLLRNKFENLPQNYKEAYGEGTKVETKVTKYDPSKTTVTLTLSDEIMKYYKNRNWPQTFVCDLNMIATDDAYPCNLTDFSTSMWRSQIEAYQQKQQNS